MSSRVNSPNAGTLKKTMVFVKGGKIQYQVWLTRYCTLFGKIYWCQIFRPDGAIGVGVSYRNRFVAFKNARTDLNRTPYDAKSAEFFKRFGI